MFALKIEAQTGGFAAIPLWTNAQLGARFTTPILKDGRLHGYTDRFFCADARTGETLWTVSANEGNSAALLDAGPVILALTVKSTLVARKPGDTEYTELARYQVADTETWAHPVVAGKRIFIRDTDNVALWTMD